MQLHDGQRPLHMRSMRMVHGDTHAKAHHVKLATYLRESSLASREYTPAGDNRYTSLYIAEGHRDRSRLLQVEINVADVSAQYHSYYIIGVFGVGKDQASAAKRKTTVDGDMTVYHLGALDSDWRA